MGVCGLLEDRTKEQVCVVISFFSHCCIFFFLVSAGCAIRAAPAPACSLRFCNLNSSHVTLWRGHLCRTCSVVWSSWPKGRLVRVPTSACSAYYDCSVCYVLYEASPEQLVATRTPSDSIYSVTLALLALMSLLFAEADIVVILFSSGTLFFARMSTFSFFDIPQWAGIHCRLLLFSTVPQLSIYWFVLIVASTVFRGSFLL